MQSVILITPTNKTGPSFLQITSYHLNKKQKIETNTHKIQNHINKCSVQKKGRSPNYTFELSQKSDFQRSTTKTDNICHPIVQTEQI
jgi:hypothetical protein